MKGYKKLILLVVVLIGCEQSGGVGQKAAEEELEEEIPRFIEKIEIKQGLDKALYPLGASFESTGLAVNAVWNDGVVKALDLNQCTIEPPDTAQPGLREGTISYAGLSPLTFTVYVIGPGITLRSMDMEGTPKTAYELGQDFSRREFKIKVGLSDDNVVELDGSLCSVKGYDKRKRGTQQNVFIWMNGRNLTPQGLTVTVRIPANAVVTANSIDTAAGYIGWEDGDTAYYRPVFIKGMAISPAVMGLRVNVKSGGETVMLSTLNGGISGADTITYTHNTAGLQTAVLKLDDAQCSLDVFFTDAQPEVYFDYGFMRHNKDPTGRGLGAGKYYVKLGQTLGQTLVLSPVRFLIGYGADYSPLSGTAYSWQVSGGEYTATSLNGEFLNFTPSAAGSYTITVTVTGRNFVTGDNNFTATASTGVEVFTGKVASKPPDPFNGKPLKNFAPGQFTKGGTGHGWSLGTVLGYEMWPIPSSTSKITIQGNGFESWSEAGIVWVQDDENGNGVPDEMWYEIAGSDDSGGYKAAITRRYAIKHFAYGGSTQTTEYGQPIGKTFWTDSKGRCGVMVTGWPDDWGVDKAGNGVWVTYTGTRLRDGAGADFSDSSGYVDIYGKEGQTTTVNKSEAIRADGSSASVNNIAFVKVQTGEFSYGGIFGDISTEIVRATGISGDQSGGFPNPLGNVAADRRQ